ncbi:MAG: hypothetical protein GC192_02185 [Bacteroidetes bacterium]|nr:hypothetical protein [Bacteroidota bacterium]
MIQKLGNIYFNLRSFKTGRKILVIESDDWGCRRSTSKDELKWLNKINSDVSKDPYNQLDTLANADDLNALFETLNSVKDKNGNPAVMTANVSTANPDFERIKKNDFNSFYFEPFYESINNLPEGGRILELWKEGIEKGLFFPQLHGREHIHSQMWMKELQAENDELLAAFNLGVCGIPYTAKIVQRRKNLQASLDLYNMPNEKEFHAEWINDSANIFLQYFGFNSSTFIAPAYVWHNQYIPLLQEIGIEAMQGIKLQYQPIPIGYKKELHFNGQKTRTGMKFLVRNAFFEPSIFQGKDWISLALKGIEGGFKLNQIVILGTHRVNFIGNICEKNRKKNLDSFRKIINTVVRRWPEIEFFNSSKLINLIK